MLRARFLPGIPLLLLALLLIGCDQARPEVASDADPTAAPAPAQAAALSACGCTDLRATIRSEADFETFTARGIITGDLRGVISFTGDPLSVAEIVSEPFPPLTPGTFSFTSRLRIRTADGTLTTRGVGIGEPGPFAVATEFHRIVRGTRAYEGASGVLYLNVEADETGTRFTEAVSGQLCRPCS